MKVSVLLPVYNAQTYLKEAIESILNQSFQDFELIIINDGSTDKSDEIICSFNDNRIVYVKNETNLKLIETLNKGIKLCKGKYIARMDADDISMPQRLERQYQFMESNPAVGLCGSWAKVINEKGEETGKIKNFTHNKDLKIHLLFSVPFVHPSVMMKAELLKEEPYAIQFSHAEDYDLWCRLSRKTQMANIPEFLFQYRWHSTNISQIENPAQISVKEEIIKRELKFLELSPNESELKAHQASFKLYFLGKKNTTPIIDFSFVKSWYNRLIAANKQYKIYDQSRFSAYIWIRWFVICHHYRKYMKIYFPFGKTSKDFLRYFFLLFQK